MKHIKSSLVLLLLIASTNLLLAQTYTFRVMASSGKSTNKSQKSLVIGSRLNANDKITVSSGSYLGLAHANGGTVQISKAGTYDVKDLENKMNSSKLTVSQKYKKYIIGEMTKAGDEDIHKNPYKYQNVTGSVERALLNDVRVYLAKTSNVINSEYIIKWDPTPGNKTYIIDMYNVFDESLKSFETTDTSFVLKLTDPKFNNEDFIKMTVKTKEIKPQTILEFGLTRFDPSEKSVFDKKYVEFKKSVDAENPSVFDKLNEAMFFEENKLYLDALNSYEKVLKMAPGEEDFRIAYEQFLLRTSIIDEKSLNAKTSPEK